MTYDEVRAGSQIITEQIVALPQWQTAETVCVYLSFGKEVATHALIRTALSEKILLAPRIEGMGLAWHHIKRWEDLEAGPLGILEPNPDEAEQVYSPRPDLILVPGLAFDRAGHRIGFGRGYYDRFLVTARGYKLGLAHDWQVNTTLPSEPHDIAVDAILTEKQLLSCSAG